MDVRGAVLSLIEDLLEVKSVGGVVGGVKGYRWCVVCWDEDILACHCRFSFLFSGDTVQICFF